MRSILTHDQSLNVPAAPGNGTVRPCARYLHKQVQIEGTFAGGWDISVQGSVDGSNWVAVTTPYARPSYTAALGATLVQISTGRTMLHGGDIRSSDGSVRFVQLFDAASTAGITVNTTAPSAVITLEGVIGRVAVIPHPCLFRNGLVASATTLLTGDPTSPANPPNTTLYISRSRFTGPEILDVADAVRFLRVVVHNAGDAGGTPTVRLGGFDLG